MKLFFAIALIFLSVPFFAQEHVNLKKGFAAEGYDVVAYFANEAKVGNKSFISSYKGVKYVKSNVQQKSIGSCFFGCNNM